MLLWKEVFFFFLFSIFGTSVQNSSENHVATIVEVTQHGSHDVVLCNGGTQASIRSSRDELLRDHPNGVTYKNLTDL